MKKLLIVLIVFLLTACGTKTTYVGGNTSISKRVEHMKLIEPDFYNGVVYTIYDGTYESVDQYNVRFNIEHIFPAHILGDPKIERDLYNMRFAIKETNNRRSNLKFVNGTGSQPKVVDGGFYPGSAHKGDVARALMYMAKTYNLDLSSMIEPSLALEWHIEDPVDQYERKRAIEIEKIQQNKNYFIENESLANRAFGNTSDNSFWVFISVSVSVAVIMLVLYKPIQTLKQKEPTN